MSQMLLRVERDTFVSVVMLTRSGVATQAESKESSSFSRSNSRLWTLIYNACQFFVCPPILA